MTRNKFGYSDLNQVSPDGFSLIPFPDVETKGSQPMSERTPPETVRDNAVDAGPEIDYWAPRVAAYDDETLLVLYKFGNRDIGAQCHDMPEGIMHSITNVELMYIERELEKRLGLDGGIPKHRGYGRGITAALEPGEDDGDE